MTNDPRLKRLKFRAWHRGMKEMDYILGKFFDARGAELTEQQLDEFEVILEYPDADMFTWVSGRVPTPEYVKTQTWGMILEFWDNPPH